MRKREIFIFKSISHTAAYAGSFPVESTSPPPMASVPLPINLAVAKSSSLFSLNVNPPPVTSLSNFGFKTDNPKLKLRSFVCRAAAAPLRFQDLDADDFPHPLDRQDDKADVILKYMPDEARLLKAYGELLEDTRLNEGIAGGLDEEDEGAGDDYIEFEDEDIDKI